MVAALGVPAGVYNVVEDEPMRRQGVVGETLARSLRVSNRKLRSASGWTPRYRTALDGFGAIIAAAERRAG